MMHRDDCHLVRRASANGCALHELEYAPGVRARRGPAEHPVLVVTLSGHAMETDGAGLVARRLMSCTFAPASTTSIAHVSEDGWRVLVVNLTEPWALATVQRLSLASPASATGSWTYKLCERLYQDFLNADKAALVSIGGVSYRSWRRSRGLQTPRASAGPVGSTPCAHSSTRIIGPHSP